METIEIFQVLQIAQTKDQQAIKNAYRKRLSHTNPEDDPEGFKRLRRAYEEACAYAKKEDDEEKSDDTPSGLWVERAAKIYGNITKRCDIDCWRELFRDDVFLSLEEEEDCRRKFLYFLMRHFKLPTDVWKLLDEKLHIVSEAARLREILPADFVHYMISKCERGEDLDFSQFEGEPEAPYDLYLQYYDRCWNALQERQLDQVEECIRSAEELPVYHPVMEVCRAHLLVEQKQVEEAILLMKGLYERYPKDPMVCYNTAECLWNHDRRDEGAQVYHRLKEENDSHYMANIRLTEWYYEKAQYEEAKKCAEKVLTAGADDLFMELLAKVNHEIEKGLEESYRRDRDVHSGLELGWCYLQDGKMSKGIRIAEELRGRVPGERDSEHKGLLTKLYMEETEYESALSMAEEWMEALQLHLADDKTEEERERDKDRIKQYHVIRMQIWRAQGDMKSKKPEERRRLYEKAIEEASGLLDDSLQDVGLFLEMAQIYLEMEEYEHCLELTGRLIDEYQVYAAYATEVEAYCKQRNASGVIQAGRSCIQYFPGYIRAYERMAKVYLDLGQNERLKALLEEAKANHVESVILDAYQYQMTHHVFTAEVLDDKLKRFYNLYDLRNVSEEQYQTGLPILTEYLYNIPSAHMLIVRGLFHSGARRYQAAKEDYEKVLADNPCHPYALKSLGFVYRQLGDYEKALVCQKRALRYRDAGMSPAIYQNISDIYSLLGDYEKALEYAKYYAERTGYETVYMMYLAQCMTRCGDVKGAVAVLEDILKKQPFNLFSDRTDLYQMAGDSELAEKQIAAWKAALRAGNNRQTGSGGVSLREHERRLYVRMAWQDLLFGDGRRAPRYYEKALKRMEMLDDDTRQSCLCAAVFACILCGDERRGRRFAARIRPDQTPLSDQKRRECRTFFSLYYSETEEHLGRILDRGDAESVCRTCSRCVCRDIEVGRLLLLFRRGQIDEAGARLKADMERQPFDIYLMAVFHLCGKVPVRKMGYQGGLSGLLGKLLRGNGKIG
ncbi:MAG: tetratricopeptide repeat protein [Candidatus Gastranaerophilales bacterium]|nr:tetratricopeptide repeat protein [Candidatus Gastranaerophilales bacterium]